MKIFEIEAAIGNPAPMPSTTIGRGATSQPISFSASLSDLSGAEIHKKILQTDKKT